MKLRFLVVVLLALVLFIIGMTVALAADGTKQVGLVIAFPDGTHHAEIVTVPVTATTYEVLAKAQIELIGANAQFGPAVCSINKVGCPAANCFCDAKHFWAFYHLDSSGQWAVSQEGVGSSVPADRAVEGLAWSDMDASFNPLVKPPVLTFAQILAVPAAASATQPAPAPTRAGPGALPTTGGNSMVWLLALAGALLFVGLYLRSDRHSTGGSA